MSRLSQCKKLIAESEKDDFRPTISHWRDIQNGMLKTKANSFYDDLSLELDAILFAKTEKGLISAVNKARNYAKKIGIPAKYANIEINQSVKENREMRKQDLAIKKISKNPSTELTSLLDKIYDAETRLNSAVYIAYLPAKEQALIKANPKYFTLKDGRKSVMLSKAGVSALGYTQPLGKKNPKFKETGSGKEHNSNIILSIDAGNGSMLAALNKVSATVNDVVSVTWKSKEYLWIKTGSGKWSKVIPNCLNTKTVKNSNTIFNVYTYRNYYGNLGLAIAGQKAMPARYLEILFSGNIKDAERFYNQEIKRGDYWNRPKSKNPTRQNYDESAINVYTYRNYYGNLGLAIAGQKAMPARYLEILFSGNIKDAERFYNQEIKRGDYWNRPKSKNPTRQNYDESAIYETHIDETLDNHSAMFQGAITGKTTKTVGSDYTNAQSARLGMLAQIIVKTPNGDEIELKPKGKDAFLSMDIRKNLQLAGKDVRLKGVNLPAKDELFLLGEIKQIDYITQKTHIEKGQRVRYYHELGEVTGELPTLWIDSDGMPVIVGGNYDVWKSGIVN